MAQKNSFKGNIFIFPLKFYIFLIIFLVIAFSVNHIESTRTELPNRPITHFKIDGNISASQKLAVEKFLLDSYFKKSFPEISQKVVASLEKKYSFINHVTLKNVWPNAVNVTVEQYNPMVFFNYHKLILHPEPHFLDNEFLSTTGKLYILYYVPKDLKLPYLYAPDAYRGSVFSIWTQVGNTLNKYNLHVKSFTIQQSGIWIIKLTNGIDLEFGTRNQMEELSKFMKIYPYITAPFGKKITYINLSYNDGASVRFN